ncbi:ABC transporter permease [Roseibium sp. SCP14]|uniref:ABC transporter permease n=1 Tax=Roseibium sp. SCP14 TaxID=3141375 RepID=UPI00333DA349
MALLLYFVKRILVAIPLLIGISIVSFGLVVAVPGDFVDSWMAQTMAQTGMSAAELKPQAEELRQKLGLDKSLVHQYVLWLKGIVFSGDFGQSFVYSKPVTEVIGLRLPRTLGLAIVTLILGQGIGVLLGIYAATHQYKLGDNLATLVAFLGIVIPKFVMSLIILYLMAYVWNSSYIGSLYSPEFILQEHFSFAKLWDFFLHVWPILFISVWAGQAYTTRMMRGNLLDVMNAQYIETARAKGLSRRKTLFRHAVPNALHPVIMNMGGRFDYMIKGEIEIAIVLGIPTLGPLILSSVTERDMYVLSAIFLLVSVLLVIGNLIADFALAVLDPRVRRAEFTKE